MGRISETYGKVMSQSDEIANWDNGYVKKYHSKQEIEETRIMVRKRRIRNVIIFIVVTVILRVVVVLGGL